MTGNELKTLRRRTGMSQAALAEAIGMSRASIGRMERGTDVIERRTELALRYIAEKGLSAERPLLKVHEDVAAVLDDAAARATPSIERTERLTRALEEWTSVGGSDAGRQLLYQAQGVIGQINVTEREDPLWSRTMADLRQLKLDWAAVRS